MSELEIGMELCADAEAAIHQLTRRRFEAVIVDCTDQRTASRVLRSARSAPVNKRAVAVAILSGQTGVGGGVRSGSPLRPSPAALAGARQNQLSRRACLDEARTAPERPHSRSILQSPFKSTTAPDNCAPRPLDLGEGGMAIPAGASSKKPRRRSPSSFLCREPQDNIECVAHVAWENPGAPGGPALR